MATPDEVKAMIRSFIGLKGAFTRLRKSNERLVDYAPTVPNASTRDSLQKALDRLEVQYEKLNDAMAELHRIASAKQVEELELEEYADKLSEAYEGNRAYILDAINTIGTPAREALNQNRAQGAAGGQAKKLAINKSLKPFTLSPSHTPIEFKNWARQFKGYYRSSNLDTLELPDQQLYLQSCIEPILFARIQNKIDDTTVIFDNGGCIDLLIEDFDERWPLFNRRMAFFSSEQGPNQDLSAWVSELEELADGADLETITMEDILIFRILGGSTNLKIRHELTKISVPTLKDYKKKIVEMEVSRRMELSIDKSKRAKAAVVKGKSQPGGSKMTLQECRRSLTGKCYRCGDTRHETSACSKQNSTCTACGKPGHISKVCFKRLMGLLGQSENKQKAAISKGKKKEKAAKVTRSAPSTPAPSDSEEEEEDDSTHTAAVLRHKLFAIKTNIPAKVHHISNPTPRLNLEIQPRGKGTPFHFDALPDTGCTTNVISDDLRRTYGLTKHSTTESLVAADDSDLACCGAVYINVNGLRTKALVTTALSNELIIGWRNLEDLGVIPRNFPTVGSCHAVSAISTAPPPELQCPPNFIDNLVNSFNTVFSDRLPEAPMKGPQMKIHIKEGARPRAVTTTKQIPHHWKETADQTLKKLLDDGIIEPVPIQEPCDWISPAFFVPKADGKSLRLVTDFSYLNQYVRRPVHPFPSASQIMQSIPPGSLVFAKLDAVQGYHQIPVDVNSRKYTTFLLPSGRYRYKRGPMGLCSTNDEWCFRSDVVVADVPGCNKIVDDILIAAPNYDVLNDRLHIVLNRCIDASLVISKKKLQIGSNLSFAGFNVSSKGVSADPDKSRAITDFPRPQSIKDVRSFLGMANQLGCFVHDLAMVTAPLRELLKKDVVFLWTHCQEDAFQKTKSILTSTKVLSYFDASLRTTILTDASKLYGLGFALIQTRSDGTTSLIQCGSRSLSETESRYAPIEQECLAVQWGIDRAQHYLRGCPHFTVLTDHRPLEGLFKKSLGDIDNRRLQRIREKLVGYTFDINWVEGKSHLIADAFSRYPVDQAEDSNLVFTISVVNEDLSTFVSKCYEDKSYEELVNALPLSLHDVNQLPSTHAARNYLSCWNELSTHTHGDQQVVVYKADRLLVPPSLRPEMLQKLHQPGHPGMSKMKRLAQDLFFWPGITRDIQALVASCEPCRQVLPSQPKEPLVLNSADYPLQQLGCDLFNLDGKNYLAIVDRFSGFIWVKPLRQTATSNVTTALLQIFNDFGYPTSIQSDNGPQFRGPFKEFCDRLGIQHVTSSPYNPSSNGLAESAVKQAKKLLTTSAASSASLADALYAHRNTPRTDGLAPADLLFGFRQRRPSLPSIGSFAFVNREEAADQRRTEKRVSFERRGGASLKPLQPGDPARLQSPDGRWSSDVTIDRPTSTGRSYVVSKEGGECTIRNRRFLRPNNE